MINLKLNTKNITTSISFFVVVIFFGSVFLVAPTVGAATEIPAEFKNCTPTLSSFTATPQKVTKRDQGIKLTASVRTNACIVSPVNGKSPQWNISIDLMNDAGTRLAEQSGYQLPVGSFIRPSDFNRLSSNPQSPDYNKYEAKYTTTVTTVFNDESVKSVTLVPNMRWADFVYNVNTAQGVKVTAPASTNTNTNTNTNSNTNTAPPGNTNVDIPSITNPFGPIGTVSGLINRIINIILGLIVMAAVIVIVISGFRMIAGGNSPEQLKKAKTGIIWAIIGLLVAFMSFAIVSIVQKLL